MDADDSYAVRIKPESNAPLLVGRPWISWNHRMKTPTGLDSGSRIHDHKLGYWRATDELANECIAPGMLCMGCMDCIICQLCVEARNYLVIPLVRMTPFL